MSSGVGMGLAREFAGILGMVRISSHPAYDSVPFRFSIVRRASGNR